MAQGSSETIDRVVYPVPFDPSVVDLLGERAPILASTPTGGGSQFTQWASFPGSGESCFIGRGEVDSESNKEKKRRFALAWLLAYLLKDVAPLEILYPCSPAWVQDWVSESKESIERKVLTVAVTFTVY